MTSADSRSGICKDSKKDKIGLLCFQVSTRHNAGQVALTCRLESTEHVPISDQQRLQSFSTKLDSVSSCTHNRTCQFSNQCDGFEHISAAYLLESFETCSSQCPQRSHKHISISSQNMCTSRRDMGRWQHGGGQSSRSHGGDAFSSHLQKTPLHIKRQICGIK